MANVQKKFGLNIMQWNAQSLRPKLSDLKLLLSYNKIHIALICETWLEPDSGLNVSGYHMYRKDRDDGYGGVLIMVHNSIKAQDCKLKHIKHGIEVVCIELLNCCHINFVMLLYCPPSVHTNQTDWDAVFKSFKRNCLIAGDFNAHHTNWSNKVDSRGNQIYDAALEHFISLNNGHSTRIKLVNNVVQQTSPDISFISSDIAMSCDWQVTNDSLGSDHLIIKMKFNFKDVLRVHKKRNFNSANWTDYSKHLEGYYSAYNCEGSNIQMEYNNFINQINSSADLHIPMTKEFNNPCRNFRPQPYWNQSLSKMIAQRRLALSQFRKNPTPSNLHLLQKISCETKLAIQRARLDKVGRNTVTK
ncbi:uncharacterized protein LOC142985784 [Anticarsia gemmatalis]|uniref:uncharacterized protein LOC142985784 n=1 Tax=Anticarsia gemmatalis TaxID=129554 RepID=UPI003F758975